MLLRQLGGEAIVTAPTRSAVEVLASFAGETLRFMAPDALLASKEKAAWLIVDEAAAIPAPLLRQLVSRFPRTLLTTTVQGYEGTVSRVPAEILRQSAPSAIVHPERPDPLGGGLSAGVSHQSVAYL